MLNVCHVPETRCVEANSMIGVVQTEHKFVTNGTWEHCRVNSTLQQ